MTYVGNRTINMTLFMLFLIGNKKKIIDCYTHVLIQIILLHGFDVCISVVRLNRYVIKRMNECLATPQHGNRSANGCQNKVKLKIKI